MPALACAACAPSAIALPDSPHAAQVDAVAAIYASPTGTIDTAHVQDTVAAANARLGDLHLDWLPDLIAEALTRLAARLSDAGEPTDPDAGVDKDRVVVSAVVNLKRVCRGWSDPAGPPDEATNGSVNLTAVVERSRLRDDIWGSAVACKTRLDPADASALVVNPSVSLNLLIDASLDVRLYGPLPRSVGDAKFLLLFSGRLGTDARAVDSSFDFRVIDGHFDFRLAVSDGDIIVEVGATTISLRASNATLVCDLASLSCQ
ncbi:MAG TPA: hypothetical protein VIF57_28465 [Polyangia bacterium]